MGRDRNVVACGEPPPGSDGGERLDRGSRLGAHDSRNAVDDSSGLNSHANGKSELSFRRIRVRADVGDRIERRPTWRRNRGGGGMVDTANRSERGSRTKDLEFGRKSSAKLDLTGIAETLCLMLSVARIRRWALEAADVHRLTTRSAAARPLSAATVVRHSRCRRQEHGAPAALGGRMVTSRRRRSPRISAATTARAAVARSSLP